MALAWPSAPSTQPQLTELVGDRFYHRIPNTPTYPLVSFGNTMIPVLAGGIDAANCYVVLRVWAEYEDLTKSRSVGAVVIGALHDELQIAGASNEKVHRLCRRRKYSEAFIQSPSKFNC